MDQAGFSQKENMDYLNGLRALAALKVALTHLFQVFPDDYLRILGRPEHYWIFRLISFSPFHLFWGGIEVILFFYVLSGFVMALPYTQGSAPSYGNYLTKRVCRIYIPYAAILFLSSILLLFNLGHHEVQGTSDQFLRQWVKPVDGREALSYLFMNGDFTNLDRVVWSLVYELKICLIFPFLAWAFLRMNAALNAAALLICVAAASFLAIFFKSNSGFGFLTVFYYIPFFIFGITAAKYRREAALFFKAQKKGWIWLWLLGLFILFNWRWEFGGLGYRAGAGNWAVGAASAGIILLSFSDKGIQKILSWPPLLWLGKRSFSFYLVHVVVLLAAVHYLPQTLGLEWRLLGGFIFCFPATVFFYRFVERPSRSLGYWLLGNVRAR